MTTTFLAPDPVQSTFFIPGTATPGNGVLVFTYLAGSTTKVTVYKDNAAGTIWTNPIVLDSGGNLASGATVWIPQGVTVKFVWAPSNDADPPLSPYRTIDNVSGLNDVGGAGLEWFQGGTPVFQSATQFLVSGDNTSTFTAGRRVQTVNTAGTVYSEITRSALSSGSTAVFVSNDPGTALDSGLSTVKYGLLDPVHPSVSADGINRKASTVAASGTGTTNIWGIAGDFVHISGTNSIYNFSTSPYAGLRRDVIFDNPLTLISSNALSLPGNVASLTVTSNARAAIRSDSVSTSVLLSYTNPLFLTVQSFTSAISSTYITPPGCIQIYGRMVGGGGGGCGGGSTSFSALAGSSSIFGPFTVGGGEGGNSIGLTSLGGHASTGVINITGQSAACGGLTAASSVAMPGGVGGGTVYSSGGPGGPPSAGGGSGGNAVAPPAGTGVGGGGGASGTSTAFKYAGGGGGAGGYSEFVINNPTTSYVFTVGAGGATTTFATIGAVGSCGRIDIFERYTQ